MPVHVVGHVVAALAVVALAVLPLLAVAHPPLPGVHWCQGGEVVPVSQMDSSPHPGSPPAPGLPLVNPYLLIASYCSVKNCGEFDDYEKALFATQSYCDTFDDVRQMSGPGDYGDAIPLIENPPDYIHSDHHRRFQLGVHISGTCVRCAPLTATSAPTPAPWP